MLFYVFIPCVVMAGAVDIFNITGAVDIADSAFSDNQAAFGGGRILSLDNNNVNDNDDDTLMYLHVCRHFERVQTEWTAYVALVVVILYDLCSHDIHDRRIIHYRC